MASSTASKTCPICKDELRDPRLLPCIHSFCLECLEQYCESISKIPGDDAPCPVCRTEFEIPKNGVAGLSIRTQGRVVKGGPHGVRSSGAVPSESGDESSYCEEHEERLRMYCFDCKRNICSTCCFEAHAQHKFERIERVVEPLVRSIDYEISQVVSRVERYRGATAQVEAENNKFLDNIKAIEQEVKDRSKQQRQLIDRQEQGLLQNIEAVKVSVAKGAKLCTDEMQLGVSEMESFTTSSSELRSKSSPSELVRGAEDVRVRAKELLQTYTIPSEYRSPRYKFTPVELPGQGQNVIGQLVKDGDTSDTLEPVPLQPVRERRQPKQRDTELVWRRQRQPPPDSSAQPLRRSDVQSGQSTSLQQLQQQQDDTVDSFRQTFLNSSARTTHNIAPPGDVDVLGVTSVGDELFVLLERDDVDQLAVYSVSDYQLLRHLSLPGLKPNNMTSCVQNKCLYMSEYADKCIDRFDLTSSVIAKWKVPGSPCGLSVTPSCNVLVTCRGPNKLIELSSSSGQSVREITLQSDIEWPQHGVQLTTGPYVVCHGPYGSGLHRVCDVDVDGGVTRSYGGERGFGVGRLDWPCHMAVDQDSQFIFVADYFNHRIVLLSPTLEFVRYFNEGLSVPCRLYFHQATRRLYVGQVLSDVTVIQL